MMCLLMLATSADAADPDRILLLHSFGPDFSPWNTITPPFREALRKLAPKAASGRHRTRGAGDLPWCFG
jgi:hypothetical protein